MSAEIYDEVVAVAGGATELARLLGEQSVAAVSNWRRRGFPVEKCKTIEALTGISVQRLRPDDWRKYWPPVLTATAAV